MTAALVLLAVGLARADLPPPPGFVESCTEAVCGGDEARRCASYKVGFERPDCEALETQGFTSKCRGGGATVGFEVLCKARSAAVPEGTQSGGSVAGTAQGAEGEPSATPPPSQPSAPSSMPSGVRTPTSGGCATAPAGNSGAALLLALGVLAARRRR